MESADPFSGIDRRGLNFKLHPDMRRIVQAEVLDSLSPDAPAALASRRDLRIINRLMGNFRWFASNLQLVPSCEQFIELGAGDGGLGLYLNSHDSRVNGVSYIGVDLITQPADWPPNWRWQQQNLLDADFGGSTTLLANLILHHFQDDDLARIGAAIANSSIRTLLFNEPVRRPLHLWQMSLARLLRFHPVTYQDAQTSIRAGFRKDELVCLLQLDRKEWTISHSETFMGANRIAAHRT